MEVGRKETLVTLNDVATFLTLAAMFVFALILPRAFWTRFSRACAWLHCWLRRPPLHATVRALNRQRVEVTHKVLACELLAANYLENMETMNEYIRDPKDSVLSIEGVEHVRHGLKKGRGVILWRSVFCFSALIESRAYKKAGFTVLHLRARSHPFSDTVFGRRFLNPIRTQIEDRYLGREILLVPAGAPDAMREMNNALQRNEIVMLTAIGSGKEPITVPFLGGALSLARGAPSLAKSTGAVVIPTAIRSQPGPRYIVEFLSPLEVDPGIPDDEFHSALATTFANRLEPYVRRRPGSWRGWLMDHTWCSRKP